ncbi:MAG: hypothetical protein ACHQX4_02930 [Gemmatimonadales bacterium]
MLLRLTPPAGQVSHYRTGMRIFMPMPGDPAADSSRPFMIQCIETTQTVDSSFGDGAIVRSVTDSARLEMPGSPGTMPTMMQDILRGMTVTQRMDSRGRVRFSSVSGPNVPPSVTGDMTGAMSGLSSRLPALPEQPIRVGETWADSQPVVLATPGSRGTGWVRIDNRLDSLTLVAGVRTAAVWASGAARYDVTTPQLSMTVTGTSAGQVLWDLDHGRLERMTSLASGEVRMHELGQVMPFRMTMTMALVDAGQPPDTAICAAR